MLWAISFLHRSHFSGWCSWDYCSATEVSEVEERWAGWARGWVACWGKYLCSLPDGQVQRKFWNPCYCCFTVTIPGDDTHLCIAWFLAVFLCCLRHLFTLLVLGVCGFTRTPSHERVHVTLERIEGTHDSGSTTSLLSHVCSVIPIKEYHFGESPRGCTCVREACSTAWCLSWVFFSGWHMVLLLVCGQDTGAVVRSCLHQSSSTHSWLSTVWRKLLLVIFRGAFDCSELLRMEREPAVCDLHQN